MTNFFEYIRTNPSFTKLVCDDLLFVEYKCPITESKLPIWSEANYLAYVLSGRKIWSTNSVSYELKEGDSIFVSKGAHYIEQIMEKEFCVLIFFLPDEFIEEALLDTNYVRKGKSEPASKFIPIEVNEPLQLYFQSMASLFSQKVSPSMQLISLKFKELILQILDYQNNPELLNFFNSVTSSPERKFKQMIENNLSFNLGIEEYSKMAAMSQSTFKRFFKKVFQSSPGQFIINNRLAIASTLLQKSNKSIQEVARESGFENASHFARMFSKKFKISPSQYRQK